MIGPNLNVNILLVWHLIKICVISSYKLGDTENQSGDFNIEEMRNLSSIEGYPF